MKKRVLALVLCLCMAVLCLPCTAFAVDGEEGGGDTSVADPVATVQIGDNAPVNYATFTDVWNAIPKESGKVVITLLKNADAGSKGVNAAQLGVLPGQTITLTATGEKTLTFKGTAIWVQSGGTLNLTNDIVIKAETQNDSMGDGISIDYNGVAHISGNAKIEADYIGVIANGWVTVADNATISGSESAVLVTGRTDGNTGGTAEITGGTFTATGEMGSALGVARGSATVTEGTFTASGKDGRALSIGGPKECSATIKGGIFKATGEGGLGLNLLGPGTASISGGTFSGSAAAILVYNATLSSMLAENYAYFKDNTQISTEELDGKTELADLVTVKEGKPALKPVTIEFTDPSITAGCTVNKVFADPDFSAAAVAKDAEGKVISDLKVIVESDNVSVVSPDAQNKVSIVGAGTAKLTASTSETDTYAAGKAEFTVVVKPRSFVIGEVVVEEKTFDGTTTATVASIFNEEICSSLGPNDFTATANFASANASEEEQTVTGTITLKGDAARNYTLANNSFTTKSTIKKATWSGLTTYEIMVNPATGLGENASINIPEKFNLPSNRGETSYSNVVKANASGLVDDGTKLNLTTGVLTLTLGIEEYDPEFKTGTLTTDVVMQNYEQVTLTIKINYTDKAVVTIPKPTNLTFTYNGSVQIPTLPTVEGETIKAVYTQEGTLVAEPTNAGTYTATYSIDSAESAAAPVSVNFTINKAKPTGEVTFTAINSSEMLHNITLSWSNKEIAGVVAWNPPDVFAAQGTAYAWTFTPSNQNYETVTGTAIPWPSSNTPSDDTPGNPGGSTSTTTPTPAPVEVKPTTTVTGTTATATVTSSQGSTLVEAAKQPNTDEVTVKVEPTSDVTTTNVTIPASTVSGVGAANTDLKVETPVADITLPSESLKALGTGSSNVTVTAAVNTDDTVSIAVKKDNTVVETLPQPIKATIPVSDVTSTTVAVLVDANGNETIVPKSVAGDDEMKLLLDGSATIKFKDNVKAFTDTKGHWAENDGSIGFATSRELFQGTGGGAFSPDTSMTRGMIVTVLHRLESTPKGGSMNFGDVPSNAYYADAVAWGNEHDIVKGTGSSFLPNDNVTREQLATFLYRYASAYGVNTTGRTNLAVFPDSGNISSYAKDALEWAYNTGLIKGGSDGRLNPTGNAKRAEVAAILMRFVEYINK